MSSSFDSPGAVQLEAAVQRCQTLLAHAWMVRTFVKHSPEVEEFPELMLLPRTVFDVARSLESRREMPVAYFRQLGKKLRRLKAAAAQFAQAAPLASTHLNFEQAVVSFSACIQELETIYHAVSTATTGTGNSSPASSE